MYREIGGKVPASQTMAHYTDLVQGATSSDWFGLQSM